MVNFFDKTLPAKRNITYEIPMKGLPCVEAPRLQECGLILSSKSQLTSTDSRKSCTMLNFLTDRQMDGRTVGQTDRRAGGQAGAMPGSDRGSSKYTWSPCISLHSHKCFEQMKNISGGSGFKYKLGPEFLKGFLVFSKNVN